MLLTVVGALLITRLLWSFGVDALPNIIGIPCAIFTFIVCIGLGLQFQGAFAILCVVLLVYYILGG